LWLRSPFPGADWLDRIATPETKITLNDETTFSSAYAAILNGAPLSHPCRNLNAYINSIFFSPAFAAKMIDNVCVSWAHYLLCYLRNFLGAIFVYYGTAGIFHYFCYVHPMSKTIFKNRKRPDSATIWHQIRLSQASMTVYTMLPVFDEFLIESGFTKVYYTIDEIGGWPSHIATMILYFACVEIGIYWMHRTLHTNKTLYKYIHLMHHAYNKPETLTPWASIAFHPLDGIMQASPYVMMLFFVPCHYLTHFAMLFFTAIWATYIHDAMDWNIDPVMGSKYHTVHHTHYIYNYGQVFIFCDWFWGTLRVPDGPTGVPVKLKGA
jgi:lathosterol oxidase